ncbi:threonine aldolase family protein [Gryllotalpicola ginsengisoli]|uniref:threonine aldolase family protein n=1 Tax=Gryllotalpicola ginsengisoli TaxID=444608 RepID=UPI0003B4AA06|nr:aminotransferase class I/II-fold pyridoxal phosphate-dependent enzyme [Gryllotalpicola ginsengisoli]
MPIERLHDPSVITFASDNYAGVIPEVLEAIAVANGGHQSSYGADAYTARLQELVKEHFGDAAEAHVVLNGTGANVLALQSVTERWSGVVCAASAHINTDENGAPERVGGLKLLPVETPDGKLTPDLIDRQAWGWGDQHRAQPSVVSITQATEFGTVYTADEIADICDHAHRRGMTVHLDGARIANAAAALDLDLGEFTTDVGVDIISFGGSKNGMAFGEAVVIVDPEVTLGIEYLRKADMQVASKQRFISAQLVALLEDGLWLRAAQHANEMAALLRERLEEAVTDGSAVGLTFTQATQSNAVFAALPRAAADRVREQFHFYDWNPRHGETTTEVRWMTAWDTTEEDVEAFADAILDALDEG